VKGVRAGRWRCGETLNHHDPCLERPLDVRPALNLVHLDAESVEAIARRLFELLTGTEAMGMIDATELARRLGVKRDYVYRHKDRLGAVRVGDGKRARLRFDPEVARSASEQSVQSETLQRKRNRQGVDVPERHQRAPTAHSRSPGLQDASIKGP
jgi:hypothetical protein